MKRTPIARRTPLKAKTELRRNTPLKSGGPIKRSTPIDQKCSVGGGEKSKIGKLPAAKRSSMRGHGRSAADVALHDRIAALGCIACRILGCEQIHPTQIHHTRGRNKGKAEDESEKLVIPLCANHHDLRIYHGFMGPDGWVAADRTVPSVHHRKKAFVAMFGTEDELVRKTYALLGEPLPSTLAVVA